MFFFEFFSRNKNSFWCKRFFFWSVEFETWILFKNFVPEAEFIVWFKILNVVDERIHSFYSFDIVVFEHVFYKVSVFKEKFCCVFIDFFVFCCVCMVCDFKECKLDDINERNELFFVRNAWIYKPVFCSAFFKEE